MFAILFEVLLIEIPEEIHHFAGWEGGGQGAQTFCEQTGVFLIAHLQFPNAVILNAVGRRNTEMSPKELKCAQKSANASLQKGAKERKSQPAPKYHTKGCSHSSADSPGARTLVLVACEPFLGAEFRASIVRTPFCAVLWRSPIKERFRLKIAHNQV